MSIGQYLLDANNDNIVRICPLDQRICDPETKYFTFYATQMEKSLPRNEFFV